MKQILIPNRFLHEICKKEQEKNFRNKLKKIKSSLTLSPSPYLPIIKNIDNINKKIKTQHNSKLLPIKLNSFKKNFSSNHFDNITKTRFKNNELKLQMFNIAQNNLNMYQRLLENRQKSSYDTKTLFKGYRTNQGYKKISCVYPTIDFFKNKRIENYCFTCNSKKEKLRSFLNTLDKYLKPQQKDLNRNTYEKLFFSNEIKNEFIFRKKKNKLALNTINMDNSHKKKFRKYFKTYSGINEKNNEQKFEIDKEQEIKNGDIINSLNMENNDKNNENGKEQKNKN